MFHKKGVDHQCLLRPYLLAIVATVCLWKRFAFASSVVCVVEPGRPTQHAVQAAAQVKQHLHLLVAKPVHMPCWLTFECMLLLTRSV
jgi:hypothetical protein